ncbi:MAG TPA: lipid-binding SYLF domain-containing protein [Candidatus Methylacidiphilales bacterium]|nr:lipid-binding SYLF domain-containing protein [Candidatus Methylacidiphilales bacterium]
MKTILIPCLSLFLLAPLVRADDINERIADAIKMLEKKQGSLSPIPQELLTNARGVAFATIEKGGLGIGGMGGEGIVFLHKPLTPPPSWSAPSAFNISGGSLGAQIGFSEIRYIFILNTDAAVRQFSGEGKVKWDATAMGTAGTDTAVESESTRELSQQAVIVYRDSGGIFGGATLGGSTIETKNSVNQMAYGPNIFVRDIFEGRIPPPPAAERLYRLLNGER